MGKDKHLAARAQSAADERCAHGMNLKGVTLKERAQLVLMTLGETPAEIRLAYHKLAKQHHPDMQGGDVEKFKVINEAYELLAQGHIPKQPLLANDDLLAKLLGRRLEHLVDLRAEWEKYDQWSKAQFYGVGVI